MKNMEEKFKQLNKISELKQGKNSYIQIKLFIIDIIKNQSKNARAPNTLIVFDGEEIYNILLYKQDISSDFVEKYFLFSFPEIKYESMNEKHKIYNKNNNYILTKEDKYKNILFNKIEDEEEKSDIKTVQFN